MKKIAFSMLIILMVAGLVASACAAPAQAPAPAPTPAPAPAAQQLDIGVCSPLTGPMAFLGNQTINGNLLAIEDQNAKGGVTIGGQKYILNPIVRDTKFDVVVGKNVAEELVYDKKVKLITGPFLSDGVGAQTVTEKNKVLLFLIQFANPQQTGPSKSYSYAVSFPIPQMTYKLLYYTDKKLPGGKTVLSLGADVPDLGNFTKAMEDACKLLGYNWIGCEKFSTDTRDFAPFAARVLTYKADIIDAGNTGGVMGGVQPVMLKQLRAAGYTGPILIPAAPPEEVLVATVPAKDLDKVISQYINVDGPVVNPKYRDVCKRYQVKYKEEAVDIVPGFYNVMAAFFDFLNTQNTMDTTAWTEGFSKYCWDGLMDARSCWIEQVGDGINRRAAQNNWVTHYENGKPVTDFTAPFPWELFVKPPSQ
jgi:branched-chain amino acid transport system substrate-binding protein